MKSFRPPFSKGGRFQGQRPWSRPQARISQLAVLFGSFSCGYIAKKKNGNGFLTQSPNSHVGRFVNRPYGVIVGGYGIRPYGIEICSSWKFLRRFFQKATGARGNAPKNAVLFGSFSCGYIAKKKNGNGFLTQSPNSHVGRFVQSPLRGYRGRFVNRSYGVTKSTQ